VQWNQKLQQNRCIKRGLNMAKQLILSVSIKDCEVQTFRAGGKGGQKQNKTNSGVRVIHHPSGARAEGRDAREQHINKKNAFLRMIETKEFKTWHKLEIARLAGQPTIEEVVDEAMQPKNIKVEVRGEDGWVDFVEDSNADNQQ
jgi:protein subunit release factor B